MPQGDNLAEAILSRLYGPHKSNDALNVAAREGLFNLKGDRSLPERQEVDAFNVVRRVNGGTAVQENNLYHLATDTAQADSVAELESARLGVYRAGVQNEVSAGLWIDSRPQDDGEIRLGYGDNTRDDGIYHVFKANDWQVAFERTGAEDIDVSRAAGEWERGQYTEKTNSSGEKVAEVFGLDPLDNSGDSRVAWDSGDGYVYGLTLGWYGPLSTMAWVETIADFKGYRAQRRIPLFLLRPVGDPSFEVPNQPVHVSVDGGTTADDVQCRVGGRQFSIQGDVQPTADPTTAERTQMTVPMDGTGVGPKDLYPVAVVRRKPSQRGVAIGLEEIEVSSAGEPLALYSRVIDSQYLGSTSYRPPRDQEANQTALEFDLEGDTPTRVTVETFTDSTDGVVKPQGYGFRADHVGAATKNTPATGDLTGDLAFPQVREVPTVFFARTRTGTTDEVDVILKFQEVGN